MKTDQQPAVTVVAAGIVGLGVLALAYRDFAMQWQPVAPWFPARTVLALAAGILMLACGVALVVRRTAHGAVRILFPYAILWFLLKVPAIVVAPGMEAVWLGAAEIAALLAGVWTLFARMADLPPASGLSFLAGERGVRAARILFAVALLPIGVSHFIYVQATHDLVPAWLPFRTGWGYLTGAGQVASGLGILFGVLPRVAAFAEAIQISLFTLLIWIPAAIAAPHVRLNWTALCISWTIGAAAWAVAQNTPSRAPLSARKPTPARVTTA